MFFFVVQTSTILMWKDVMKQMKHHETVKDMFLGNYETPHFSRAWHAVFWMNHHSEIQLDSGCPSLVMTDILQQLIGIYHRDQSVLHRCCKILVYFSHQKYHMSCLTILLVPGRFGPMTSFIERSSRTDRRWVASFIFSEHFLLEAKSVVETSCLRNIWNYIIHDQDLRSSVTCWAMCGVLCAWKTCITPWITVVAIGPCGKQQQCFLFLQWSVCDFSDRRDSIVSCFWSNWQNILASDKTCNHDQCCVSLLVYGILASFTRFTR